MIRFSLLMLFVFLIPVTGFSEIQKKVKVKILSINPSQTDHLETTIRFKLPEGVSAGDVIDASGMEVVEEKETNEVYVTQKVTLEPKEARTFEVFVRNVWVVTGEEFTAIREKSERSLEALEGTKFQSSAQLLYDKVRERLDIIEEEQDKEMTVKKRMGLHHAHKRQLEEIKGEVLSLGALRQLKTDDEDGIRTAKFLISARNPADEARQMTVRSVLPTIIKSSDVIDRKGFTLLFDERSGAYVLEKVEQFDARETRKYTVEIRDVWYIPEQDMNFLREKTEDVLAHFEDTEFENYADQIGEYIYETLTQIELLQAEVSSSEVLKERVQAFVLNQQRLESAKKKFKELQDLLLEIPMKRSLTVTEQVKQSLKQIAKLLDVLSVGFKPDLSTTWWTILGICVFIAIFATSFYVIWIGKLNENPWGKKDVKAKGKPKEKAKADVGQKAA